MASSMNLKVEQEEKLTDELNKILAKLLVNRSDIKEARLALYSLCEYVKKYIKNDDQYDTDITIDPVGDNLKNMGTDFDGDFDVNVRFHTPLRPRNLKSVIVERVSKNGPFVKYGLDVSELMPFWHTELLDLPSQDIIYYKPSKFKTWAIKLMKEALDDLEGEYSSIDENILEIKAEELQERPALQLTIRLQTVPKMTAILTPCVEVSQHAVMQNIVDWNKNADLKTLSKKTGLHFAHLVPSGGELWKIELSLLYQFLFDYKDVHKYCIRLLNELQKKQKWNLGKKHVFENLLLEYHYSKMPYQFTREHLGKMFFEVLQMFLGKLKEGKIEDMFFPEENMIADIHHQDLSISVETILNDVSDRVTSIRCFF